MVLVLSLGNCLWKSYKSLSRQFSATMEDEDLNMPTQSRHKASWFKNTRPVYNLKNHSSWSVYDVEVSKRGGGIGKNLKVVAIQLQKFAHECIVQL